MEVSSRRACIWQPWLNNLQLVNAKNASEERPKVSTNLHRKPSSAWRRERRRDPIQSEALDMSSGAAHSNRPSVIVPVTPAPGLHSASSEGGSGPNSGSASADLPAATGREDAAVTPTAGASAAGPTRNQRKGVRQAGVASDPAIDEHFKRSLGLKEYAAVFDSADKLSAAAAASDKEPGLTVDDHFAKALGETWTRLQATTRSKQST